MSGEPRGVLSSIADADTNGRILAISLLLRMGWPVSAVARAVKLASEGDVDAALSALMHRTEYHTSGATEGDA